MKLPGLWRIGWIFLQGNAPSHIALCVQQFLASKNIAVLFNSLIRLIIFPATSSFFQSSNPFSKEIFCLGRNRLVKNEGAPE
jgi:hypothetical protein